MREFGRSRDKWNTDTKMVLLRRECHNSKFGIFELLVYKETSADALLIGIVS